MSTPKPAHLYDATSHFPRERMIQDDGTYLLVSTKGLAYARTSGLLLRRCASSEKAPYGYECLGQYQQLQEALWHASLGPVGHSAGLYAGELDALVNLWASRRLDQLGPTV
jgi:hypothetical protein